MDWIRKTLKDCWKGNHDYVNLQTTTGLYDTEYAVNQCLNCGAVSLDTYVDGRLMKTNLQRYPRITKEAIDQYNENLKEKQR